MKLDLNISERDKRLLIGLIAIVLLACSYFFGYQKITEKNDVLNEEVTALKSEYDKLYKLYENREKYEALIVENDKISNEILGKYAANASQEFQIMHLRSMETDNNWISTYGLPVTTTKVELSGVAEDMLTGNTSSVNINFKADYENMMAFIKNINENRYKTGIEDISISYNVQDSTYTGQAKLAIYAISGTNREPERVDTTGVIIRNDENIFTSDTFTPGMTMDAQSKATQIRNDSDLYVLVNPWGSSLDSVITGFTKDNTGKSNVSVNGNEQHTVTITISGANGEYKAAYKVGNQSLEATDFYAGESIDILISSAKRTDDVDVVSASINIINNSDKVVNYTTINDDVNNSRVIVNKSGQVDVY